MNKPLFITFEGIEGSGKSTHARMLYHYLTGKGVDAVLTREPGGTDISMKIREILLSPECAISPLTELLLYCAARAEHAQTIIAPALKEGKTVVCDRFTDSTRAYQGYGRGISLDTIIKLEDISAGGVKPDLTFLLDVDVDTGLKRNKDAGKSDRLENEEVEFHNRVRNGFLELHSQEPARIRLIDANRSIADSDYEITKAALEAIEG